MKALIGIGIFLAVVTAPWWLLIIIGVLLPLMIGFFPVLCVLLLPLSIFLKVKKDNKEAKRLAARQAALTARAK